jgi:hypothetical protein
MRRRHTHTLATSSHHRSRPSVHTTFALPPAPQHQTILPGQPFNAASTIALPPLLPSSLLIRTRDAQSFTRSRSDSAENPAKRTLWMAPMCAQRGMRRRHATSWGGRTRRCLLLDAESRGKDVRERAHLAQELGAGDAAPLAWLVCFVDDCHLRPLALIQYRERRRKDA